MNKLIIIFFVSFRVDCFSDSLFGAKASLLAMYWHVQYWGCEGGAQRNTHREIRAKL